MLKWILGALAAVAIGVGVYLYLDARRERDEAIENANVVADTFSARVDVLKSTIEERGRIARRAEEVADSIRVENGELADRLDDEKATALSYLRANAILRDSIRNLKRPVFVLPDSSRLVSFDWARAHDEENFVLLEGSVLLDPDLEEALVDLDLEIALAVDVSVSRAADMSLRCDVDIGLPGVEFTRLSCIDSLEDPLDGYGKSFALRMFEPPALATGVVGLLLGVALGLAAGL